jgi:uridine kinase
VADALRHTIRALVNGLPPDRRTLLAIDGIDGSRKSVFAASIAGQVTERQVVTIHVDDFLNPPNVRHCLGRNSPQGFFQATYDYEKLKSLALQPL